LITHYTVIRLKLILYRFQQESFSKISVIIQINVFWMLHLKEGVRGHPSKTSGRKGGGVDQCGRSSSCGHQPDVHKRNKFCVSEYVSESTTPARPRASGSQYILRFERFDARYDPDVRGQGGCLPNGRCWTRGCPKSQFLI